MVAAGMGVAIGPHAVTRLRLDGILFKELDGLPDTPMMELSIAWRESAVSPGDQQLRGDIAGHRRELYERL